MTKKHDDLLTRIEAFSETSLCRSWTASSSESGDHEGRNQFNPDAFNRLRYGSGKRTAGAFRLWPVFNQSSGCA